MGIDQERFQDVSQELICCICTGVLEDPVELPCRHVFCSECISTWMKEKKTCPTCRKSIRKAAIQPALPMIKNILGNLRMRCLFASQGCTQIVEQERLNLHEATCDFSPVKCSHSGCEETVPRKDLKKHENDCPKRLVACSHDCGLEVKLAELRNHNCIRDMRAAMTEQARQSASKINNLEERVSKLEKVVQELSFGPRSKACFLSGARESDSGAANGRTSHPSRRTFGSFMTAFRSHRNTSAGNISPQRRQSQRQSLRSFARRQDRSRSQSPLNRNRSRSPLRIRIRPSPPQPHQMRNGGSSRPVRQIVPATRAARLRVHWHAQVSSTDTVSSTRRQTTDGNRHHFSSTSSFPSPLSPSVSDLQMLPSSSTFTFSSSSRSRSSSPSTSSTSPSTSSSSSSTSSSRVVPREGTGMIFGLSSSDSSDTD